MNHIARHCIFNGDDVALDFIVIVSSLYIGSVGRSSPWCYYVHFRFLFDSHFGKAKVLQRATSIDLVSGRALPIAVRHNFTTSVPSFDVRGFDFAL